MGGKNLGGKLPWVAKIWVANFHRWQKSGWQTSMGGKNPWMAYFKMSSIWVANFHGWQKSRWQNSSGGLLQQSKFQGGKLPGVKAHPARGNRALEKASGRPTADVTIARL